MYPNHDDTNASKLSMPVNAVWLGGLGVVPFAAASAAAVLAPPEIAVQGEFALLVYGAVILSFLGGILWGRILAFGSVEDIAKETRTLIVSIVPSLIGWIAVLVGPGLGLPVLTVAFFLMLFSDLRHAKGGLFPAWYPKLRVPLTFAVIPLLMAPVVFA